MKVSVIIPVMGGDPRRLRAYNLVLDRLTNQTHNNIEIIVIEQTGVDKETFYSDDRVTKYKSIMSPYISFNLNWCKNVGTKYADGDLLVTIGSDILVPHHFIERIIDYYKSTGKKYFITWNKLYKMTEQGVEHYLKTGEVKTVQPFVAKIGGYDNDYIDPRPHAATGVIAYEMDFLVNEFAGFNETFFGWGFEDNETAKRLIALTGEYPIMKGEIYHFPHPHNYFNRNPNINRELFKKFANFNKTTEELKKIKLGNHTGPTYLKVPGIPKIYIYNPNVGSGIERTGTNVVKALSKFFPIEYRVQNPPAITIRDLIRQKPEIIIMNEFYSRTLKSVYYYKSFYPDTKVILLNHCYDGLENLPPKDTDSDGQVLVTYLFRDEMVDHIINLNYIPSDTNIPQRISSKIINHFHPVEEKFDMTIPFEERKKDFIYYGNVLPHKLSEDFINKITKTDIVIDLYGRKREGYEKYYEKLESVSNLVWKGYIPEDKLIDTINQYRFFILPHHGYEPFNLTVAEAIRCGTIPLITNDRNAKRPYWIDWARDCYIEYKNADELISGMKLYLSKKSDKDFIQTLGRRATENSEEMKKRTSIDSLKQILVSLIKNGN